MKIIVIGSGVGGMSAAAMLARAGHEVIVLEKNDKPGGRINMFEEQGFRFDMGPSWYWMPEVFDAFYQRFGYTTTDFYELVRLDPSYKVFFDPEDDIDLPADRRDLDRLFDRIEPGSSKRLGRFLESAAYKYQVGMDEFVWKPGHSITEFMDSRVMKSLFKLKMLSSISSEVTSVVKDSRLRRIMEFPVLFLGSTPQKTPALYSLMNYADMVGGTWYPKGGMYEIAKAFYKICLEQGVQFEFDSEVTGFDFDGTRISTVKTPDKAYDCDQVISNADYHHIDQNVLPAAYRQYTKKYWDSRKLAPSSLLVFLGLNKKVKNLRHHNLFFDANFELHAGEIYNDPQWPSDPLFYVCVPSLTDPDMAPEGCENIFLLMPLAPDLEDSNATHEKYLKLFLTRIQARTGQDITDSITVKKFFSVSDFKQVYNSFRGNAYGLANTLTQTAFLKPQMKSRKLTNLLYAGQLTTPGPGLPPSIISGQVAAIELMKNDG